MSFWRLMAKEWISIAQGVIRLYGMGLDSQLESCVPGHYIIVNGEGGLFGCIVNFLELRSL